MVIGEPVRWHLPNSPIRAASTRVAELPVRAGWIGPVPDMAGGRIGRLRILKQRTDEVGVRDRSEGAPMHPAFVAQELSEGLLDLPAEDLAPPIPVRELGSLGWREVELLEVV